MSSEVTSPKPRSFRRTVASAAVLLGIVGSLLFTATSPAQANTGSFRFVPTRICVVDIEDWWPDDTDEVVMTYGARAWGASIRQGNCAYPPAETFTGSTIHVNFYENDRGYNNLLGTLPIQATDLHLEKLIVLGGSGFRYDLYYKVVPA
jgi:hypothetical protein